MHAGKCSFSVVHAGKNHQTPPLNLMIPNQANRFTSGATFGFFCSRSFSAICSAVTEAAAAGLWEKLLRRAADRRNEQVTFWAAIFLRVHVTSERGWTKHFHVTPLSLAGYPRALPGGGLPNRDVRPMRRRCDAQCPTSLSPSNTLPGEAEQSWADQ